MKKRCFTLCFLFSLVASLLTLGIFMLFKTSWSETDYYAVSCAVAAAIVFSLAFGEICARAVTGKITSVDPDEVDADECDAELKPLMRKIVRQDSLISSQMSELKRRNQEFNAITENMAEGLIVCDSLGKPLIVNSHAKNIYDFAENPLDISETFARSVQNALMGKGTVDSFELNGCIYRIYANPLMNDDKLTGCVILLLDITQEEKREIMRREFTSNVSHELKTPLTSIYGISEILAGGIVRQEDIPRFAQNIHNETGRLITLVNDIIKLSQMDENSIEESREPVDLKEVCISVISRLKNIAEKNGISLSVEGNCKPVSGIRGILEEMVYNLCDNGIKYNSPGGNVKITLSSDGGSEKLTVTDNGIGIAPQNIPRIFERFYRVDKSHSKQVGGTGLGLSIVKHGASYHGATIDVKSTVGKGTSVSISFPSI